MTLADLAEVVERGRCSWEDVIDLLHEIGLTEAQQRDILRGQGRIPVFVVIALQRRFDL